MTSWKNLVVALVAAFALAACSSSDNGGGSSTMTPPPAETGPSAEELQAQIDALRMQLGIDEDDDVGQSVAALQAELQRLQGEAAARARKEREDAAKAMAATGKALHGVLLGDNKGGQAETAADTADVDLSNGLSINPEDASDVATDIVTLEPPETGAAAGSLGSWKGTNYELVTGTGAAKITNTARVYTNQGAASSKDFDAWAGTDDTGTDGLGEAEDGKYTITVSGTNYVAHVGGSTKFPTSGQQTYTGDERKIRGTYAGAAGMYECTGDAACTASHTSGGITLAGAWTFDPDAGVKISIPDAAYLYFGWWTREDANGPTHADVFAGTHGTLPTGTVYTGTLPNSGTATYTGKAAGKFALYDPSSGTGNAGHFTADAELTAKFGPTYGEDDSFGISGTIDGFKLNGGSDDPGWSVALGRNGLAATGGGTAALTDGSTDADTDPTAAQTVWSINGNEANPDGSWSATMYDEKPGTTAAGGDGSTVPTTVTGVFEAMAGSTRSMAGAFGATRARD